MKARRPAPANLSSLQRFVCFAVVFWGCVPLALGDGGANALHVEPVSVALRGSGAQQQLLVSGTRDGLTVDLTRDVEFRSDAPENATVDSAGMVKPAADGQAVITIVWGDQSARVSVEASQMKKFLPVSFELDVQPILTTHGCNAGACHGKSRGQNGFQLSLLGFDADFDYAALTKNSRGRRVFPTAAERSLLLLKSSVQIPHGGGARLKRGSRDYNILHRWIASGVPRRVASEPVLTQVSVIPAQRYLRPGEMQQLLVTAHYSDNTRRDVTTWTTYQSSESAIVSVSRKGLIEAGPTPGEATIMARYMEFLATCQVAIPLEDKVDDQFYARLPRNSFIDDHVWRKLATLGITPSKPIDDAKFVRRVHLDIIGRIPRPAEVQTFLADDSPGKRERLVDELLERPEYADFWANKWVDLLRPNPYRVGIKAVLNYDNWIRESFRQNKPYDQFVRELITAQGSTWRNGAVTMFRDRRSPDELVTLVSQLFLGIRLECAKCHHHPFEQWEQRDFYGLAAYFAEVGYKGGGLSPPISGDEEMIYAAGKGEVRHPVTGELLSPTPLFGEAVEWDAATDPREALAEWITSDENQFFSEVIVNRIWADLMGRGLVEPVDDLRATNPPTNEPLLKALAAEFRRQGYDLKSLLRIITNSHVYSLSSLANERNLADTKNYSRHLRQRLRAEVLLDAMSDITGVPYQFTAMPPRSRAVEIWTHRVDSLFLDTFGRPGRDQAPPCERTSETTVTQALHLMNSPALYEKVTSDAGTAAKLADSDKNDYQIIEKLYLLVYNRYPKDQELLMGLERFSQKRFSRRQMTEDLMWALLNTPEFLFKD